MLKLELTIMGNKLIGTFCQLTNCFGTKLINPIVNYSNTK